MSITQLVSTIQLKDTVTFTIHSQSLTHNFQVVKQCLMKIKDLQNTIARQKQNTRGIQEKIRIIQKKLDQTTNNTNDNGQKIKQINENVGESFMTKMHKIQQKTKNMYDFDQTVQRLQKLAKFVSKEQYNNKNIQIIQQINKVSKIRQQLSRYIQIAEFNDYKVYQNGMTSLNQSKVEELKQQIKKYQIQITSIKGNLKDTHEQIKLNNQMMKEISFSEMVDKLKKFQEDTTTKVQFLATKMKKKVNQHQLLAMEKIMVDKIDKFLAQTQQGKAQKSQTKEAFLFLEKKFVELNQTVQKTLLDQDNGLFTSKKVQCASCTKDLGKYEGKLGQFHPWSVFPCKELDPEKSGGFGYLNYIDKTAYKRGIETDDQNLQRLNKTTYDPKDPPKKPAFHRGFNIIHNFGQQYKEHSLKQSYFSTRGSSSNSKIFRVTKKQNAKLVDQIDNKQKHG